CVLVGPSDAVLDGRFYDAQSFVATSWSEPKQNCVDSCGDCIWNSGLCRCVFACWSRTDQQSHQEVDVRNAPQRLGRGRAPLGYLSLDQNGRAYRRFRAAHTNLRRPLAKYFTLAKSINAAAQRSHWSLALQISHPPPVHSILRLQF